MDLTDTLNVSIFVIFLGISAVPFYVSKKLGATALGLVSLALGAFAILHGTTHLLLGLGDSELALTVFGPISTGLLLVFAVYMYQRGS